jgi:hypothetical protein
VEPIWIGNANPDGAGSIEPNDTFMTAFGGRLRIRPSVYLVGEWAPRLTGYAPGTPHGSFAIEKRVGQLASRISQVSVARRLLSESREPQRICQ